MSGCVRLCFPISSALRGQSKCSIVDYTKCQTKRYTNSKDIVGFGILESSPIHSSKLRISHDKESLQFEMRLGGNSKEVDEKSWLSHERHLQSLSPPHESFTVAVDVIGMGWRA